MEIVSNPLFQATFRGPSTPRLQRGVSCMSFVTIFIRQLKQRYNIAAHAIYSLFLNGVFAPLYSLRSLIPALKGGVIHSKYA